MTITLYIIRHGATKSNKRHAYLGNTNEPLSNEGGEQIIFYNEAGRYPKEKDKLAPKPLKCPHIEVDEEMMRRMIAGLVPMDSPAVIPI